VIIQAPLDTLQDGLAAPARVLDVASALCRLMAPPQTANTARNWDKAHQCSSLKDIGNQRHRYYYSVLSQSNMHN